jgi:lipoprotein-anchoring transpeptidase ErfK/SrfK
MRRASFHPIGIAALVLAGAALSGCNYKGVPDPTVSSRDAEWMAMVPKAEMDLQFERYEIADPTGEEPGTIVVDTRERFLYFVLPGRKAIRYGVAVGDEAFGWTGEAVMQRKAEWPRWTPTANMIKTQPERYAEYAAGLEGGLRNPLGARALYLYRNGKDTHFRQHGTLEPYTIGQSVSSGCVRLINQDIIDLYSRVPSGTRVTVVS